MSINIRYIDPFVLPSTLNAAYLKAVNAVICFFFLDKFLYLFEGKPPLHVALVDIGVLSISCLGKREGGEIIFRKLLHLTHCAIIVNHSVSTQL